MRKKKQISPTVQPKAKAQAKAKPKPAPATPSDVEYQQLWDTCTIKTEKIAEVDRIIDEKVIANRKRYEDISQLVQSGGAQDVPGGFGTSSFFKPRALFNALPGFGQNKNPLGDSLNVFSDNLFKQQPIKMPEISLGFKAPANPFGLGTLNRQQTDFSSFGGSGIPWYFIACVHYLECSFSFKKHLHNGDPLTGYTVQVPAGRPKVGHPPPFTFEESSVDALKLMGFDKVRSWILPFMMRKIEAYNGFGYFKYHKMNSPYLWSFSNHYAKGKYVKDGKFDKEAVSQQTGAAVILKRMEERGLIFIPRF